MADVKSPVNAEVTKKERPKLERNPDSRRGKKQPTKMIEM